MVGCDNLLIFGQVAPVIFQKYGQVVLLCDRQSTLRYMIRCSKQSAITITSLHGTSGSVLKSKLYVQKGSTINMMF